VKAPLSHVKLLAVGGVDEKNIADYAKAGACGFGIGSNIVNKKLIEEGAFDKITELAKEFLAALN
jgi:2-dehydro-3-deoxyphosphogluconate aldolase/(4S)-4-hydroxy-2-oxoglutarate aldolase